MWNYEKRLQYPINIKTPNAKLAQFIMSQYGGPDGEIGASMRYLSQRYSMPYPELKALLTDIGTEELAHMEMISAIVYQLTRNLTPEQIKEGGFDAILMDVMMPVRDGHEATRAIRAMDRPDAKTIPIFAMTANAFTEDRRKALESGMNAHIAKPVDVSVLLETLSRFS